jgi:hypothetical protein
MAAREKIIAGALMKSFDERGLLGTDSYETKVGDQLLIKAALPEQAFAYLIAFNFDGKVQLCWPVNDKGDPDEEIPPPQTREVRSPAPGNGWFTLDDDAEGGWQAFVLVASRTTLLPYAKWREKHPEVAWKKLPAGEHVWTCDGKGVYPMKDGKGLGRGKEKDLAGAPPLKELCESLRRRGGFEVIEAIAFPVRAKE